MNIFERPQKHQPKGKGTDNRVVSIESPMTPSQQEASGMREKIFNKYAESGPEFTEKAARSSLSYSESLSTKDIHGNALYVAGGERIKVHKISGSITDPKGKKHTVKMELWKNSEFNRRDDDLIVEVDGNIMPYDRANIIWNSYIGVAMAGEELKENMMYGESGTRTGHPYHPDKIDLESRIKEELGPVDTEEMKNAEQDREEKRLDALMEDLGLRVAG